MCLAGIAQRAGEGALEPGERVDQLGDLEGPVTPTDGRLPEHPCLDELVDGVIGPLNGTAHEFGGGGDGEHRGGRKRTQQQIDR